MKFLWPVILQLLAFGVLFAEVMVPSFGLLSLVCASLFAASWYFVITQLPPAALWIFGAADLLLIPLALRTAFRMLGKSPVSHRTDLGTGSGLESADLELARHVGTVARVEAQLRPVGKIRIGDDLYEAQTAGEWVAKGDEVKVSAVNGTRFLVEKV